MNFSIISTNDIYFHSGRKITIADIEQQKIINAFLYRGASQAEFIIIHEEELNILYKEINNNTHIFRFVRKIN